MSSSPLRSIVLILFGSLVVCTYSKSIAPSGESMMELFKKTGQDPSGTALSGNGMFMIPKPTSTQKQQEKLAKEINGTISVLSSQTSNQMSKLNDKISDVTRLFESLETNQKNGFANLNSVLSSQMSDQMSKINDKIADVDRYFESLESNQKNGFANLNSMLNSQMSDQMSKINNKIADVDRFYESLETNQKNDFTSLKDMLSEKFQKLIDIANDKINNIDKNLLNNIANSTSKIQTERPGLLAEYKEMFKEHEESLMQRIIQHITSSLIGNNNATAQRILLF